MPIVPQSLGETIVMLSKAHELTKDGDKDLNLEGRDLPCLAITRTVG